MIGVGGEYEITINNEIKLLLDSVWSLYIKGEESYMVTTPKELYNVIDDIIQNEVNKNSKQFFSKKITIIPEKTRDREIIITNERHGKNWY